MHHEVSHLRSLYSAALTCIIAIQGIGAGGIASLTQIVIADLVPLHERGMFNGIIALLVVCAPLGEILSKLSSSSAYCFGTSSAPLVAGALAEHGQWRWYFCKRYFQFPFISLREAL